MKGLIIAAGYGTRFLPATKTVPKEMLPLMDKPSIAFIVEEMIQSGIKDIVIITSRRKKCMDDFFDREVELERELSLKNKTELLEKIKPYRDVNICFIRQQEMKGVGHAMLQAESVIGNEPFVVAYPDDLHFGEKPLAKQLIDAYNESGCTVLATLFDPPQLYAYAALKLASDGVHVEDLVEKPAPGSAPSKEASIGRYLYTPEIFKALHEAWVEHTGPGEFYHVDGLKKLCAAGKVIFKRVEGDRYDIGTPEGFLKATVAYACRVPEWEKVLIEEVKKRTGGEG